MTRDEKINRIRTLYRVVRPGFRWSPRYSQVKRILAASDEWLDNLLSHLEGESKERQAEAANRRESEDRVPVGGRYDGEPSYALPLGNQGAGGGRRIIRKLGGLT